MVYFLESTVCSPPVKLFMGLDKHENEELLRWGWPEDIWFHVDNLSSAHVYIRLQEGQTIEDIPQAVIEDAAQLVKHNSITGNKTNDVDVIYTPWPNLHKTDGMDVGQVGFHKQSEVRKIRISRRDNAIVNRLNKTKSEHTEINFRDERESRDKRENDKKKVIIKKMQAEKVAAEKRRKEEAEIRSYSSLMKSEKMSTNQEMSGYDSDDFM